MVQNIASSLPDDLRTFVESSVASGVYADADAVVAAALGALAASARPDWLKGAGECAELIRTRDWSLTSLGPLALWPQELRTTVGNIVNSPIAKVLMWGPEHTLIYNDAYRYILGTRHPLALGSTTAATLPEIWDFNRAILERGHGGEIITLPDQSLTLVEGETERSFQFDLHYTPVYAADGVVGGVMCTIVDNTARARAERDLTGSNRRFRTAMDAMHGVLWTNSAEGRMVGEQPAWAALTGQTEAQYEDYGWSDAVHPDDRDATVAAWHAALTARGMFVHEHRVRDRDGRWRVFAIRALPILDEAGEITEWVGVHSDITHRRAAEASLRQLNETLESRVAEEIAERRQAEARLAQSQKMETIGKLTGGVAHDFNNLLQVVSGNLQLLAKDIAGHERAEKRVSNAMAGVARGSKLAAQLLAFGRRQALEPRVVNVTRFVQGMDDLIRRSIGEGVAVELVFGGGLWNTFIDPTQVENALLNLAINARDAMNGEGRLTIELSNAHLDDDYARSHDEVEPGQYVMIAVSDTGCGMAPEIVDKVFEPFFSTKSEGKGSGLGLSMVYGFVKQSGGHVKIYSEVGHGTTIRLYLPRSHEREDVEVVVETGPIAGGTETVLVVEDDEEVRATVVEMLADLGYRVLKAVDAESALNVIESGIPIDMLFTDVVMPGTLKSPELARKARERLPEIAVLFTSGYTENSIVHGGKLDAGVDLLSKPYTREALARKFRHVLANQRQRNTANERLKSAPPAPVERKAEQPRPAEQPRGERRTVLLVEDDALIRMATAELIEEAGFVVVEAGSAEEAMAALQTAPVDVLVTDINLPGASGRELAAKAREIRPRARIVFATGDASASPMAEGDIVLSKPYSTRQLHAAIGADPREDAAAAEVAGERTS